MQFSFNVFEKTITKYCKLPYLLYLPRSYEKDLDANVPLIIFLHGAGERGTNLSHVGRHGLVSEVAKQGGDFPFIMVAPQCPTETTWDFLLDELDCLLKELLTIYSIDKTRIYLTGLSMGGYGTWHWGVRQPHAFAALIPICGGTRSLLGFPERIAILRHVPIWVFHGADDQLVPVRESEKLVSILQNEAAPVRFTKYQGVGHHCWNRAYREPELFSWLLEQRNPRFNLVGVTTVE